MILANGTIVEATDIKPFDGCLSIWTNGRRAYDSVADEINPPDMVLSRSAWLAYR